MNGLVLAAGASRRALGCKALFACDARSSWLDRTIETQRVAGVARVLVVVAPPWESAIRRSLRPRADVRVVHNPRPELGMLGSVRIGLAALLGSLGPTVISLIDHPEVRAMTLRAMLERATPMGPSCVVRPRFGGRHGHPIVIGDDVARLLRLDDESPTLRQALSRAGVFRSVDVDDAAVLQDHDGPLSGAERVGQRTAEAIAFAK